MWTALLCYTLSSMMFCLTTGPKAMEPNEHGLKLWAKISPSSFDYLRYFVTVVESWLTVIGKHFLKTHTQTHAHTHTCTLKTTRTIKESTVQQNFNCTSRNTGKKIKRQVTTRGKIFTKFKSDKWHIWYTLIIE